MSRKSCIFLTFPIAISCYAIILLIITLWFKKGYFSIGSFILFFVCFIAVLLRKGIEVHQNSYRIYIGLLGLRKGVYIKLSDKPSLVIITKINKNISVSSSKSILYSNSRSESYYQLQILVSGSNSLEIIKSKDYNKIEKYAKLFSSYYNITVQPEDLNIEYPATGDYIEYSKKTPKPHLSKKRIGK